MANIRDYQERIRHVEDAIAGIKDQVELIETIGDGEEYKEILSGLLFDLYNMIDDLAVAYDKLTTEVIAPHILEINNN